jgi:hypothetical protein
LEDRTRVMTRVAKTLRKETGIDELQLQAVWIPRGQTMLCGQLPARMRAARRQQEDERLDRLHDTISAGSTLKNQNITHRTTDICSPALQKTQLSSALDTMQL